jgi:hypothetical protein
MNSGYQRADGERVVFDSEGHRVRTNTFPEWWGKPPDGLEARGAWIRSKIAEGKERLERGERVEGQRPRTGRQALAALEARVWSENMHRLRMLLLRRSGPQ